MWASPLSYYRCHTAAVRKQNHASATTTAEIYRIIAYIENEIGVAPAMLEEDLESRAQRFIEATSRRKLSVADVWRVYQAAGHIDRRAAERILIALVPTQGRRRAASFQGDGPPAGQFASSEARERTAFPRGLQCA